MSHSIHVATKGQNDYSGYWGAFDHEEEGINTLIEELCESAIFDDEDTGYATEICVERRELLIAADTIEQHANNYRALFAEWQLSFSPEALALEMRKWAKISDQSNDRVYLAWF